MPPSTDGQPIEISTRDSRPHALAPARPPRWALDYDPLHLHRLAQLHGRYRPSQIAPAIQRDPPADMSRPYRSRPTQSGSPARQDPHAPTNVPACLRPQLRRNPHPARPCGIASSAPAGPLPLFEHGAANTPPTTSWPGALRPRASCRRPPSMRGSRRLAGSPRTSARARQAFPRPFLPARPACRSLTLLPQKSHLFTENKPLSKSPIRENGTPAGPRLGPPPRPRPRPAAQTFSQPLPPIRHLSFGEGKNKPQHRRPARARIRLQPPAGGRAVSGSDSGAAGDGAEAGENAVKPQKRTNMAYEPACPRRVLKLQRLLSSLGASRLRREWMRWRGVPGPTYP